MTTKLFSTFILGLLLIFLFSGCDEDDCISSEIEQEEPLVAITQPANNALVAEYVQLIASASDNKGISEVHFYVDARLHSTDAAPPYMAIWDCTGLEHGSNHVIYAIAFDTDHNQNGSKSVLVTIDTTVAEPTPVELYSATLANDTTVTLVWGKSIDLDFDRYIIRYDTSGAENLTMGSYLVINQNDTVLNITDLCDNAELTFEVTVMDLGGRSIVSNRLSATIPNREPNKTNIGSGVRLENIVTLNWTAVGICDFQEYNIYRSNDSNYDNGDTLLTTIADINITSFIDSSLTDTVTYYYFLEVVDISDLSAMSDAYEVKYDFQNNCLEFNGTSEYVTIPFYENLNLGDNYTLEAWVYPTESEAYSRVIDKGAPLESHPYLQYSLNCQPTLGSDLCTATHYSRPQSSATAIKNIWNHIALTYSDGELKFYINGELEDTQTISDAGSCAYETNLNIGRRRMFDEFYFAGKIDEVRIWNVTRTENDIQSWYNYHLAGNETGLVGYWTFDEGEGDTIYSPVGGNGYLGNSTGSDLDDPTWNSISAPIIY